MPAKDIFHDCVNNTPDKNSDPCIACKVEPTLLNLFKSMSAQKLTLNEICNRWNDWPVSLVAPLLKLSELLERIS